MCGVCVSADLNLFEPSVPTKGGGVQQPRNKESDSEVQAHCREKRGEWKMRFDMFPKIIGFFFVPKAS